MNNFKKPFPSSVSKIYNPRWRNHSFQYSNSWSRHMGYQSAQAVRAIAQGEVCTRVRDGWSGCVKSAGWAVKVHEGRKMGSQGTRRARKVCEGEITFVSSILSSTFLAGFITPNFISKQHY